MTAAAVKVDLQAILPLRALFLQESNFQVRYNACHERGWTDSYLLTVDDLTVGYGSVKGREIKDRDAVFEFFVIPAFRNKASELFGHLLRASGAEYIECQSNDLLLSSMQYEFSASISADVVLFEDHCVTGHTIPGAIVRPRRGDDEVFEHRTEPVGEFVMELHGEIVATAGFLLHYNKPFADLYMEVREDCRRRGFGSFILQEVKRACYLASRVPAARCGLTNQASRSTLISAGMKVCGFMLTGQVNARLTSHSCEPSS